MSTTRSIILSLACLCLLASGCGTPFMREALPGEMVEAPPAGKVLVNIQRPSNYGGGHVYCVFDQTKFLGCNKGEQRFQYVCDPGEHVFIGYLMGNIWATVSVIKANLAADKIYDCVVDAGFLVSSIAINPLKQGEERRAVLPEWDEDSRAMVLDEQTNYPNYEADQVEDNEEILEDFLRGEKQERLKVLEPDDCR